MSNYARSTEVSETKHKLLEASMTLMRAHGYNATTVDHICAAAGVTKGGFFHYFKSKDEIAKSALAYFHEAKVKDYAEAPFRKLADPLDRIFGRLDYAGAASGGAHHPTKGCLIGVFAQELAFADPGFRAACEKYFTSIGNDFEKDLTEARTVHAPHAVFDPKSVAMMYVSLVQGSLMLAKTAGTNDILLTNLDLFRQYLKCLFGLEKAAPSTATATSSVAAN